MLYELFEFYFCKLHKPVDLVFGAVKVLDTERVDGHDFDAAFVANLKYLRNQESACAFKK